MAGSSLSEPLLAAGVSQTEIDVNEYGVGVIIKDSAYAATNHYIQQSKQFFPKRKLYKYVYFQRMRWLVAFLFFINLLSFDSFYVAIIMDMINLIFLIIFLQHQCVNCCTMHIVRKQPVIEKQRKRNNFYKVCIRELNGVFLENYQRNVGVVALNEQEIELQAFNRVAVMLMNHARCYSVVYLITVAIMCGYSGYFTFFTYGQWKPSDQFPLIRKWIK